MDTPLVLATTLQLGGVKRHVYDNTSELIAIIGDSIGCETNVWANVTFADLGKRLRLSGHGSSRRLTILVSGRSAGDPQPSFVKLPNQTLG